MLHLGAPSSSTEFADDEDAVAWEKALDERGGGDRRVKGLKTFLGDFDRPNLTFEVWRKSSNFEDSVELVMEALRRERVGEDEGNVSSRGVGIVYCFSQKECEAVSEELRRRGVRACPYHAGMSDPSRDACQDGWTAGKIAVVCATIAFGLGINMPTVRVVVHFTLSKSLELYYQEVCLSGQSSANHNHTVASFLTSDASHVICCLWLWMLWSRLDGRAEMTCPLSAWCSMPRKTSRASQPWQWETWRCIALFLGGGRTRGPRC
jgi:hypothetical protein